jgi:hypothetical protein
MALPALLPEGLPYGWTELVLDSQTSARLSFASGDASVAAAASAPASSSAPTDAAAMERRMDDLLAAAALCLGDELM